ncbi:O-antigen ligase family protein [Shewanella sp. TB7-MNA-CIBAN-0143]|uniref:O-antigen ligase family protein n=2 Tax=Shewanella TaxID=22 RepID=UPI003324D696
MLRTDVILIFVVFSFFFSLVFNSTIGSLAALMFIVCGGSILINNISESYRILLRYRALLIIPCLAIVSSFWSDTSMIAFRGGVQLLLTTVFSIVLICRVDKNLLLNCLVFTFIIAMGASLASNRVALNGMTGEISLIGIFSSKNYLAIHTAIGVGVGVVMYFYSEKTNRLSRILGGFLLFLAVLVLLKAKSFGTTLSVSMSLFLMYLFMWYQTKNITFYLRLNVNFFMVAILISIIGIAIYSLTQSFFDEFMYDIGKDPTLTGRTYIWERGLDLISENPILGSGYQSVFVINNMVAEDIWEYAKVESGSGFNFHNMFINIWVELGFVGFFIYVVGLILLIKKLYKNYDFTNPLLVLSIFVFFFFFTQSFLEAVLLRQFTLAQFLICLAWISFSSVSRRIVNVA